MSVDTMAAAVPGTIDAWFARQAAQRGDAVAVTGRDGRLTYGELERDANRLAHHLRTLGVGPEVPVAVRLERTASLVTAVLAVLKAGGAYVPLDPSAPDERLRLHRARRAGPRWAHRRRRARPGRRAHRADRPRRRRSVGVPANRAGGSRHGPGESRVRHLHQRFDRHPQGRHGRAPQCDGPAHRGAQPVRVRSWRRVVDVRVGRVRRVRVGDVGRPAARRPPGGRARRRTPLPAGPARAAAPRGRHRPDQTPAAFRQLVRYEEEHAGPGAPPELALRLVVFAGEALAPETLRPWIARHGDELPALVQHVRNHRDHRALDLPPDDVGRPRRRDGQHDRRPDRRLRACTCSTRTASRRPTAWPASSTSAASASPAATSAGPSLTAEHFVPDPLRPRPAPGCYRTGDRAGARPTATSCSSAARDHQVKIRGYRIELGEIETALPATPPCARRW